jgi:hypothetical protein
MNMDRPRKRGFGGDLAHVRAFLSGNQLGQQVKNLLVRRRPRFERDPSLIARKYEFVSLPKVSQALGNSLANENTSTNTTTQRPSAAKKGKSPDINSAHDRRLCHSLLGHQVVDEKTRTGSSFGLKTCMASSAQR